MFSLEATVLPVSVSSSPVSILSHNGAYDGLTINDTTISFSVEFATLGSVSATYNYLGVKKAYNIQGVYSQYKVQLYVDGTLVSEGVISDEQRADGFKTRASSNLYVGQSSDTNSLVSIAAMAVYERALTDSEAYLHYVSSRDVMSKESVGGALANTFFNAGQNSRNIYTYYSWEQEDLLSGAYTNVSTFNNNMVPVQNDSGVSLAGQAKVSLETSTMPTNIYGIKLGWRGSGSYLVEVSINGGTTWSTAQNEAIVPGTFNVSPTSIQFAVRVTFTGGTSSDTSYINKIFAYVYSDAIGYTSNFDRPFTLTSGSVTADFDYSVVDRLDNAGLLVLNTSNAKSEINTGTEPDSYQAIEFWWKTNQAGAVSIMTSTSGNLSTSGTAGSTKFTFDSGDTLYINGVSVATNTVTAVANRWYHIVYVFSAPANEQVTFTPNTASTSSVYSSITFYSDLLTASNVLSIFSNYTQYPSASVGSESLTVTEGPTAYKIYQYDWSLTQTGI